MVKLHSAPRRWWEKLLDCRFCRGRLSLRIALSVVVMLLVPLWLGAFYLTDSLRKETAVLFRDQIRDDVLSNAESLESRLVHLLYELEASSDKLAELPGIESHPREVRLELSRIEDHFRGGALLFAENRTLVASFPSGNGLEKTTLDELGVLRGNELLTRSGIPFFHPVSNRPALAFSSALHSQGRTYYLVGMIEVDGPNFLLSEKLANIYSGSGRFDVVSLNRHQIVLSSDRTRVFSRSPNLRVSDAIATNSLRGHDALKNEGQRTKDNAQSGYIHEDPLDQEELLGGVARPVEVVGADSDTLTDAIRIGFNDWVVVVSTPGEHAYTPIAGQVRRIYNSVGIFSLILVLSVWIAVLLELRPLQRASLRIARMSEVGEEIALLPEDGSGEIRDIISGFNGLLQRILERDAQLEEAGRKTREALEAAQLADRAKDEFLANMSHEIRTPLNAILGFTTLTLQSNLAPRQREHLTKARLSGEALLTLINDILDISKIAAGKMELRPSHFCLDRAIERVLSIMELKAAEKGIALKVEVSPSIPAVLYGDIQRLEQVLINLMGNAIKFTEKGSVTLEASLMEFAQNQVRLHFSVIDTGVGIDPESLDRLFQPFYQVDSTLTRRVGGTGLGLVITRQLVTMMGGEIRVFSTPGKGSVFAFYVCFDIGSPEALQRGDREEFLPSTQLRFDGARLLLVDDQPLNRELARELLQAAGALVDEAEDGAQAVERLMKVGATFYDAVLMDIQMPGMDGMEATCKIRSHPDFSGLPILAVTAHVMDEEKRRFFEAGMSDHISKPFRADEIYRTLAGWVIHRVVPAEKTESIAPAKSAIRIGLGLEQAGAAPPPEAHLDSLSAGSTLSSSSDTTARASTSLPAASPPSHSESSPSVTAKLDVNCFLAALDGFDVSGTLSRFGSKPDLYPKLLRAFAQDKADAYKEIEISLRAGDRGLVGRQAHAMKGIAASLGMTLLQQACLELERAMKEGGDGVEESLAFSVALDLSLKTIRQAWDAASDPSV